MTTPICIPITVTDAASAIARTRQAIIAGAQMVELRCDQALLGAIAAVLAARQIMPNGSPIPAIVTIRLGMEGGQYREDEDHRRNLFESAIKAGANYIDIEWITWGLPHRDQPILELCKAHHCKLIISRHDFQGRFNNVGLKNALGELRAVRCADILKLAWTASSVTDAIEALRLMCDQANRYDRPVLALAMGEFGQLSRFLGAKFGAPFTFATLPGDKGTAPGQPSIVDLLTTYRWNQQRPDTKVFGVIGWPVGHSLSPAIHNAGFAEIAANAVYVPIPIQPSYEEFKAVVDALRSFPNMHLGGLSITIPHKENALRYVRENGGSVDALSEHIGAINTIVFPESGADALVGSGWAAYGFNSDYSAAIDALADALGIQPKELSGQHVAVIGAGGAARAIVAGLAAHGANVTIYNRNLERAKTLAADFDGKTGKVAAAPLEKLRESTCRIYVNATPLGMHPKIDGCPIDFDPPWDSQTVVFDTIYNPLQTKLLKIAQSKGARTITGLEMFVRQAAEQFKHFTGQSAPVDTFRMVMASTLNDRQMGNS